MDPRIFRDESMGIYDDMQVIPQTEKIRISEK
jgi:hypothetical protein